MQGYHQEHQYAQPYAAPGPKLQEGVRQFMNGVYAWMTLGIGVTAAVAYAMSVTLDDPLAFYSGGTVWLFWGVVLLMAWFLPARLSGMSSGMAVGAFMIFAAAMGAGLGYIPIIYSAASIGMVLLATVGMFGSMALFGYITKKDLTGVGQFLVMALFGAIIASVVNVIFLGSIGMSLVISAIVAVVAAGLTAYHTQAVKQMYLVNGGRGNLAILGALLLYVDFINLFLSLLRLFGGRD